MRRWLRRIWVTFGIGAMAWLWWNARAHGVDPSLGRSSDLVIVTDSGGVLRLVPRVDTTSTGLIFLPGATVDPNAYLPMLRAVAEAGYPVALVRLPWRMAPTAAAQATVWARIAAVRATDPGRRWVLGGHSRGAALSARFAGDHPAALGGLLLIGTTHPRSASLATLEIPVMKVYGTRDCVADSASVIGNAGLLPPDTRWVRLEGANHYQFGWYGSQLGDCRATITRPAQQAATLAAVVSLLANLRPTRSNPPAPSRSGSPASH